MLKVDVMHSTVINYPKLIWRTRDANRFTDADSTRLSLKLDSFILYSICLILAQFEDVEADRALPPSSKFLKLDIG